MTCQTCGAEITPAMSVCARCETPAGAPAIYQGHRTYGVRVVGIVAAALVALALVVDAATYTSPLLAVLLLGRAKETVDIAVIDTVAYYEWATSIASLVALVVTGVLVIIWLYRARQNVEAFPGGFAALRPHWTITGWLVPFVNFVMPYRVMNEVTRASTWDRTRVLLLPWWIAWLGSGAASRVWLTTGTEKTLALPYPESSAEFAPYLDAHRDAVVPHLVVLGVEALAGALLITLILRITGAQEARIAKAVAGYVLPGMTVPAHAIPAPAPLAAPVTSREPGAPAAPGGATIGS